MRTRPEDLRGEARRAYETWRAIGLSERSAMAQLREDGLLPVEDGFDRAVRTFEALGLSESAARVAVVGRGGSEQDAREEYGTWLEGCAGPGGLRSGDLARVVDQLRELTATPVVAGVGG